MRKAVVVDQVLVDRKGVAPERDLRLDERAVRRAGRGGDLRRSDYLIPWFAPKLARIKTLSAGGVDQVDPTFSDFLRLVRFAHLEPVYRQSSWVRVDNGERGQQIVERMRRGFKDWAPDRFSCFDQEEFEFYYPEEFQPRVADVLAMPRGQGKQAAKKALLNDVRAWLDVDMARGQKALAKSAATIISDLQRMERQLQKSEQEKQKAA